MMVTDYERPVDSDKERKIHFTFWKYTYTMVIVIFSSGPL